MGASKYLTHYKSSRGKWVLGLYIFWVREAQAAGIFRVGWIPGEFNLADLLKKTRVPANTRRNLVDSIFSNIASPIGDIEKA